MKMVDVVEMLKWRDTHMFECLPFKVKANQYEEAQRKEEADAANRAMMKEFLLEVVREVRAEIKTGFDGAITAINSSIKSEINV